MLHLDRELIITVANDGCESWAPGVYSGAQYSQSSRIFRKRLRTMLKNETKCFIRDIYNFIYIVNNFHWSSSISGIRALGGLDGQEAANVRML